MRNNLNLYTLVKINPNDHDIKAASEAIERFLKSGGSTSLTLKGICAHLQIRNSGYMYFLRRVTVMAEGIRTQVYLGSVIQSEPEFREKFPNTSAYSVGYFYRTDFIDDSGEIKLREIIEKRNFIINLFLQKYKKVGTYWVRKDGEHVNPVPEAKPEQKPENHIAVIDKLVEASAMISSLPKEDQVKILKMILGG